MNDGEEFEASGPGRVLLAAMDISTRYGKEAAPCYYKWLDHDDAKKRRTALFGLSLITQADHDLDIIATLIKFTADSDPLVRELAIEALAARGTNAAIAVPKLEDISLNDKDFGIRAKAFQALTRITAAK